MSNDKTKLIIQALKSRQSLQSLTANIESFGGISRQVRINFLKKHFICLEWNAPNNKYPFTNLNSLKAGDFAEFIQSINSLKICDWEPFYGKAEGIILDGKYWSVKLQVAGRVYESEGMGYYPENWGEFCHAIEKLTGVSFQ